jgi:mannosyl-3-phosphoglycerate phosphatase
MLPANGDEPPEPGQERVLVGSDPLSGDSMISAARILPRPDAANAPGRVSSESRSMTPHARLVVFADVDGVLGDLPGGAFFAGAAATLKPLSRDNVPLVLCSSRTRAEIEAIQQELGIRHPFVCESGGAVFIPGGYFEFNVPGARDLAGYEAVEYGRPYAEVVRILHRTAERLAIDIVGFSDMSVEEVARDCHVPLLQARLAKLREYGERFRVLDSNESTRSRLVRGLNTTRLRCVTGERYDYVGAPVNTSLGVNLLCGLYQHGDEDVLTVGIEGRMADDTLLRQVDRRVTMSRAAPAEGGVDAVRWAEAIVGIAEELRRQEWSRLATVRGDHR